MIRVAHESPLSIFDMVQLETDYDYCLVHLYEEIDYYKELFLESKKKGREIILDNSIFELGVAFDSDKYVRVINELKPDWYIVPDVLEDCDSTIQSYKKFCSTYKKLTGKRIGVLQGKTFEELEKCYREIVKIGVDKIAISFDYSYYLELAKDVYSTQEMKYMIGRQKFMKKFINSTAFLSHPKPIHLLGCFLPQEFQYYLSEDFENKIDSLDTSNPIVHGLKKIHYTNSGLVTKESQKLFTLIKESPDEQQLEIILHNIKQFRKFCR